MDEAIIKRVYSRYDVFHDSYVTGFACEKDNTKIQITLSNIYRLNEFGAEDYFPEGVVLLKFDQVQILEREGVIEGSAVMSFIMEQRKFYLRLDAGILSFQGNLVSAQEQLEG